MWQVIVDLAGDKTSGPNGFPIRFYKWDWSFLKKDIMRVFDTFHGSAYLDWRFNMKFISFIPKEPGASSIGDFRPISLLFGFYKILAKVLANRLKLLLPSLVSEFQGASIEGAKFKISLLWLMSSSISV